MSEPLTPADLGLNDTDIAIVGMAGRFPGARSADALWEAVRQGRDTLTDLDPDALIAQGLPASLVRADDYVRRAGILEDVEAFDAGFFGIGARDASVMDPQHRHFTEVVWEALESAGHVPERFGGAIGVFAGCGMNTYLVNNLLTNPKLVNQLGWFLLRHTANDKDFLTTGVSYRLDLRGPSINVQTACSTSLVAIHLASQSLLAYECDMAVAGGVTIEFPHGRGYPYHPGEILSPLGRCRAFDAQSDGTVLTSGAGAVVLRRVADALQDGDPILALVKGSAINNDGSRKVSYLAPSVDGHADVVREALSVAGLSARDITLVDAHGTGTAVGDPIEVAALTEAFRATTADTAFCRLGSTKPNIGHLDTAAGVASVIKVIQALRHQVLPPLANHTAPSPLLGLELTPFVLSGEATPWTTPEGQPRRAGVSSLGVGGTNAHAVLEEAPALPATPAALPEQVLCLSARTAAALARQSDQLTAHLAQALADNCPINLADVAHTLWVGRRPMAHRQVVTATDVRTAIDLLRQPDRRRRVHVADTSATDHASRPPGVAFMFPGGGAQYLGMGSGLDTRFDTFHAIRHEGATLVKQLGGPDLTAIWGPDGDDNRLRRADASLPAVFITSVAMARQWMAWGVQPRCLIGHSLGEYAAAHLAGVMTLADVLTLVVARSRLMAQVGGEGCMMLVVPLPEADVRAALPAGVSLATVNAADECVVSGPVAALQPWADQLAAAEVECTRIPLAAAAHSALLDPVLPEFLAVVQRVQLHAPRLPYVSNLTGQWITPEQATSPRYWVDHLRHTVRFADGLATALAQQVDDGPLALVEMGPGHSLSSYARRQTAMAPHAVVASMRHPEDNLPDTAHALHAVARLWATGVNVDLGQFCGAPRRKVLLPTYPFEREQHWIEPGAGVTSTTDGQAVSLSANNQPDSAPHPPAPPVLQRIDRMDDWFWAPVWTAHPPLFAAEPPHRRTCLLVCNPADAWGDALQQALQANGHTVHQLPRWDDETADQLSPAPDAVWFISQGDSGHPPEVLGAATDLWLNQASACVRWLMAHDARPGLEPVLVAVTRRALTAHGAASHPVDTLAAGIWSVAPKEYTGLTTLWLDLPGDADADCVAPSVNEWQHAILHATGQASRVSLTPTQRATLTWERQTVPALHVETFNSTCHSSPPADGGAWLVSGGLGDIGFQVARMLASTQAGPLVLLASRPLPPEAEWTTCLARLGSGHATAQRIRRVQALRALGGIVEVVAVDMADAQAVRQAVAQTAARHGRLAGAVHAAGVLQDRLIELVTPADHEAVLGAKTRGALALLQGLTEFGGGCLALISSSSTVLTPAGQASYVAANAVLDALAGQTGGVRVVTLNYGVWAGTGMASELTLATALGLLGGHPVEHPVFHTRGTDAQGDHWFAGVLHPEHDWVVAEHRTATGQALLPGTGHLSLMLWALDQTHHTAPQGCNLADVALQWPLLVPDGQTVHVRVVVSCQQTSGSGLVRLESDLGKGLAWTVHSEARWTTAKATPDGHARQWIPLATTEADRRYPTSDLLAPQRAHMAFGPHWDTVGEWWLDLAGAQARLTWPAQPTLLTDELAAWRAHPAVMDVVTALVVRCLFPDADGVVAPVAYRQVRALRPLPATVQVRILPRSDADPHVPAADVLIADADGQLCMAIDGLHMKVLHGWAANQPPDADIAPGDDDRSPPLLTLARELGIRADEGPWLLQRLLDSSHHQLLASSVTLADLQALSRSDPEASPPSQATSSPADSDSPVDGLTPRLTRIWQELLGQSPIGPDDDFFELGGHSLIAIRLMARIQKELGVRLPLATLLAASTLRKLTETLVATHPALGQPGAPAPAPSAVPASTEVAHTPGTPSQVIATPTAVAASSTLPPATASAPRCLVPIRPDGRSTPFYIVHGAGGNVLFLWSAVRSLPPQQPVYGFQAVGVDGTDRPDASIQAMADRYVAELLATRPQGPYLLGGYSGGGLIALEMANRLQAAGHDVPCVVLFDSIAPQHIIPPPRERLLNVLGNAMQSGLPALRPYLGKLARRWGRKHLGSLWPESTQEVAARAAEAALLGYHDVSDSGMVDLTPHFDRIVRQWQPGRYAVDTVLLRVEQDWPKYQPDYYWSRYISRPIDIVTVPGDHHAMFAPRNSQALAERVADVLARHVAG